MMTFSIGVRYTIVLLALRVAACLVAQPVNAPDLSFFNPELSPERRLDVLISQLTTEEKIGLLQMSSVAVPRLNIPAYHWWNEGLHGVARNGKATVFPQALGLAAMWNTDLHYKIADAISTEFRAKHNELIQKTGGASNKYSGLTVWSPNINIYRDPRWGRGQETYGEDPFLTGRYAVAFVKGLQGNDPRYLKTVATVKHFAVHSGPEKERHYFDAIVSERDLYETYLPAFEAGIREGHAQSLMSAYNRVNGVPAPANQFLLEETLRGAWGFKGAVVGDVDNVRDIYQTHKYTPTAEEACAAALLAGNDLCGGKTYASLDKSLEQGLVNESVLDQSLRRLFRLRFLLGEFDPAERVPYRQIPISENCSAAHDQLALQAARQSIVMLKNNGALPWDLGKIKTLQVFGPTADDKAALLGTYYGTPQQSVTLLKALRSKLTPLGVKVDYRALVSLADGLNQAGDRLPSEVVFVDEAKSSEGWRGEIFDNPDFVGEPIATRLDDQIDFYWDESQPLENLPLKGVHARWTGVLYVPKTADYFLSLTFTGAAHLYLDDQLVECEEAPIKKKTEFRNDSKTLRLEAGRAYRVRVEYHQRLNTQTGKITLGWRAPDEMAEALIQAKQADHILLTLGITPRVEAEGIDRTTIALAGDQQLLIEKVAALGKPFTVVLTGGGSMALDTSKPDSILAVWYYGQRGADALVEVLTGETNPSGHLPVTFYASDADLPDFRDYRMQNRTYRYFTGKPLFAFGHGLSYTRFAYSDLALSQTTVGSDETVQVSLKVANAGGRDGDTVVQIYGRAVNPPVPMPLQQLVGFARVSLKAGEAKRVSIDVPVKELRRWNPDTRSYVVDPGFYEIRAGQASDQIEAVASIRVN